MEHKSLKKVLDSFDYTNVDNNREFLGTENPEMIRKNIIDKRADEYKHVGIFQLPHIFWQIY